MNVTHPSKLTYDLSEYKGIRGQNFYKIDRALITAVHYYTKDFSNEEKKAIEDNLEEYGTKCSTILNDLILACHKEGKYGEVQKFNSIGQRVDEILYSKEQIEARKVAYEHGIVNLDFHPEWKFNFHPIHRYALAYLTGWNGEGGVACPLAMTDGLIYALKEIGSDLQKSKYLPILTSPDSKSYFMAGQYVTERVGGSNVGANRTIARKLSNGKWLLNGEKWFCSNPGDLWVTTAKIEDTNSVGMFLVSRFKESGELNGHNILRKKDIIGSRGKLTVEIIYDDVEAEEMGRPSHGLVNLIKYIIQISRIHVGIGSTAGASRAIAEVEEYANNRTVYGKKLKEITSYQLQFARLKMLQEIIVLVNFRSIDMWDKKHILSEILIPLMKYKSSSQASYICHQCILLMGGNGIIGDFSPLPRLLNDSIINESWEGTHLLLTEHVLRSLSKGKIEKALFGYFEETFSKIKNESIKLRIGNKLSQFKEHILNKDKNWKDLNRIWIADHVYHFFAISELIILSGFKFDETENIINFNHYVAEYLDYIENPSLINK
jgi:alkylation response protein AidB-like acyl-CoA dehydrogenase